MDAKRRPAKAKDPLRSAQIKAIHAMKRELALAEDSYRAVISRHSDGRTESSADLSAAERSEVLDYLRRLGAGGRVAARAGGRNRPANLRNLANPAPAGGDAGRAGDRPLAQTPHARKIRAMWLSLFHLGEVSEPSEDALAAFVERQTRVDGRGIEALQWLSAEQSRLVIEALRAWGDRCGWHAPDSRKDGGMAAKRALLKAIWKALAAIGAVTIEHEWALDGWLQGRVSPHKTAVDLLTSAKLDQAAEQLGQWLRTAMAKRDIEAPLSAHLRGRAAK